MKVRVNYTPVMSFRISLPRINLLKMMARTHYDAHCRSMEAEYDRWSSRIEFGSVDISAPWRDIDTTCKILEGKWNLNVPQLRLAEDMATVFVAALRNSSDFCRKTEHVYGEDD